MKKSIYIALIFILSPFIVKSQEELITFCTEAGIHVRWAGFRNADLEGFNLYRSEDLGEWELLDASPITMVSRESELKNLLGLKVDLYYALFDRETISGDIDYESFNALPKDKNDLSFFEAVAITNPEFGRALGEVYLDTDVAQGKKYAYKVERIVNGSSSFHAQTKNPVLFELDHVTEVNALAASGANNQIQLTWEKDLDAMRRGEVVSYTVVRSESESGPFEELKLYNQLQVRVNTNGTNPDPELGSYVDDFLENGKTYFYRVKAMNSFGIFGPASITVMAKATGDIPNPPQSIDAVQQGKATSITWESNDKNAQNFKLYRSQNRDQNYDLIHTGKGLQYLDFSIQEGREYFLYVKAENEFGSQGTSSDTLRIFFEDHTAPAKPLNVVATGLDGKIELTWDANTESDLLGYEVERASDERFNSRFLLTNDIISESVYVDELPPNETEFGYVVYALDNSMNRSRPSELVKARIIDRVPPQKTILHSLDDNDNKVLLTWHRNLEKDIKGYRVEVKIDNSEFISLPVTSNNNYEFQATNEGMYFFRVVSIDVAGNESEASNILRYNYKKDESPAQPEFLKVEKEGRNLVLSWGGRSTNVEGYLLTREDQETGEILDILQAEKITNGFTDKYVNLDHRYTYRIRSRNSEWVMSEPTIAEYKPE